MKAKTLKQRQSSIFTFSRGGLIRFCRRFQQKLDDLMQKATDEGRNDLCSVFSDAYDDLDTSITLLRFGDSEKTRNEIRMTCKHVMKMV